MIPTANWPPTSQSLGKTLRPREGWKLLPEEQFFSKIFYCAPDLLERSKRNIDIFLVSPTYSRLPLQSPNCEGQSSKLNISESVGKHLKCPRKTPLVLQCSPQTPLGHPVSAPAAPSTQREPSVSTAHLHLQFLILTHFHSVLCMRVLQLLSNV